MFSGTYRKFIWAGVILVAIISIGTVGYRFIGGRQYSFVDTLLKAGIEKAKGLFAVTGDDNQNLVVSLTAKQLNPNLRVVAQCNEIKNSQKMRKAGADATVSTTSIGVLRMASEMVRPTVVSFLDTMLRDRERN
jgi:voltage-gated potassium channel